MSDESGGERPKLPKTSRIILFLLIVSSALGGWIWYSSRPLTPLATATVESTEVTILTQANMTVPATPATTVADLSGDGFGIVSGLATPWAVPGGPGEPTATPEPTSAAPAAAPIALLGPPADSIYRQGDTVTFYWTSSGPLSAGQQFTVYLLVGETQVPLGSVDETNLGQGYQLQAILGQNVAEPGRYSWSIAIADVATGAIIGQSETRTIQLIANN